MGVDAGVGGWWWRRKRRREKKERKKKEQYMCKRFNPLTTHLIFLISPPSADNYHWPHLVTHWNSTWTYVDNKTTSRTYYNRDQILDVENKTSPNFITKHLITSPHHTHTITIVSISFNSILYTSYDPTWHHHHSHPARYLQHIILS